ncbi:MAG: TetR/AcrR family transcriptional regulator [Balneolaceae bacterium]
MITKKSKPRERIVETASKLFHQQGYNSTGINQIIEEASVAKATFYSHFKSKDDLCVEFLLKRHHGWFEKLRSFTDKKNSLKMKIIAAFDFIINMNELENFRGCSFLNTLSELPDGNTRILKVIRDHKSDVRQYFQSLIQNSEKADHIYMLFESSIVESQLFRDNWPVIHSKEIINNLILK